MNVTLIKTVNEEGESVHFTKDFSTATTYRVVFSGDKQTERRSFHCERRESIFIIPPVLRDRSAECSAI